MVGDGRLNPMLGTGPDEAGVAKKFLGGQAPRVDEIHPEYLKSLRKCPVWWPQDCVAAFCG